MLQAPSSNAPRSGMTPQRPRCLTFSGAESRSLLRSPWPCLWAGCIEGDRGTDERLERASVDLLPLMDVNRAPCVPVEARVEELGRVLQRSPLGESQLHDILVRLTGTDHSGVRPHRHPCHRVRRLSPFHLLDHVGISLLDESPDLSKGLAPPITQRFDSRIDLVRGRASSLSFLRVALALLHGCCRFLRWRPERPISVSPGRRLSD